MKLCSHMSLCLLFTYDCLEDSDLTRFNYTTPEDVEYNNSDTDSEIGYDATHALSD